MKAHSLPAVPLDVRAALDSVAEADRYHDLQIHRQRGVYNLLTGLPGLFFVLWIGPQWVPGPAQAAGGILAFGLLVAACFAPNLLLPMVRRLRPDWESVFVRAPILRKATDKLFWVQAPLYMAFVFLPAVWVVAVVWQQFHNPQDPTPGAGSMRALGPALVGLHVAGCALLAWRSASLRDPPLALLFAACGFLPAVPLLAGWNLPDYVRQIALFQFAVAAPPIVAGLVRVAAPRRWLVA